jgi:hypothetical protein
MWTVAEAEPIGTFPCPVRSRNALETGCAKPFWFGGEDGPALKPGWMLVIPGPPATSCHEE